MSYGINVTLNLSGTASPADYLLYTDTGPSGGWQQLIWGQGGCPTVVTIPTGQTSVNVTVKAVDDSIVEKLHETLTISVASAKNSGNSNINYACDTGVLNFKIEDNDLLDLQKVVFQGVLPLLSDPDPNTGQSISWASGPHWLKGEILHRIPWTSSGMAPLNGNGAPMAGYVPLAYSSQDNMAARAKWWGNVDPAIENDLYVYFAAYLGGNDVFSTHVPLTKGSDGSWGMDNVSAQLLETFEEILGKSALYNPNLQLMWSFYVGGDTKHRNAGISHSCLYVTYDDPEATLYHTVVHTGCVAANGVTPATSGNVDQPIVDAIWTKFSGISLYSVTIENGAVTETKLGNELYYYGKVAKDAQGNDLPKSEPTIYPFDTKQSIADEYNVIATEDLLRYKDGSCDAWGNFFIDVLAAQGISSQLKQVTIAPGTGNLPLNIPGVGGTAHLSNTPLNMVMSPNDGKHHGVTPLKRLFKAHAIVQYGDSYYDPSYGEKYEGIASGAAKQSLAKAPESYGIYLDRDDELIKNPKQTVAQIWNLDPVYDGMYFSFESGNTALPSRIVVNDYPSPPEDDEK